MIPKEKQAAQMLIGKTLEGGWLVKSKIAKADYDTGGAYSSCYEVENGERKGFLKAFDYSAASKIGEGTTKQISNIINSFEYERDILMKCLDFKCKNIIQILDHGELMVDDAQYYPNVIYLILEYAEKGNVRNVLAETGLTEEWKIRSLHQMTIALSQLHKISIAHQDLKPSNIVVTKKDVFKLTDLGSAYKLDGNDDKLPDHLNKIHSGTWEYLPPELLYGYVDQNNTVRRIGCDVYLLGNMVCFYYTSMSMNAHLKNNLVDSLAWTNLKTQGNFTEIKPLLSDAFNESLVDIGRHIEDEFVRDKIITVIRYLCNPDPSLRGHADNIKQRGFNYSLNRIVTIFSELIRYQIIKNKKNGGNL